MAEHLKPWYAVATPHKDIREGRLEEAVFATAVDDIKYRPSLVIDQIVIFKRPGQQGQYLLQFLCAFLGQSFLVEGIALDQVVLEYRGCPDTKPGAAPGLHPVPHRDDDVEVIEVGLVHFAVSGSCPEFPDNCRFLQLTFLKDVADMFRDRSLVFLEELRRLGLAQPDRFILKAHIKSDASFIILALNDFTHAWVDGFSLLSHILPVCSH